MTSHETVKNIIMNCMNEEMNRFVNNIDKNDSVLDANFVLDHISKRKEQFSFILDNFEDFMNFNNEIVRLSYEDYGYKNNVAIEVNTIDRLLSKGVCDRIIESSRYCEDSLTASLLFDRCFRIEWLLSKVDVDTAVNDYKNTKNNHKHI